MALRARLAARWMNSLVFPIFCRRQRTISSASWSMLFFKARKRSPRVLMARRDTLERRLVTLEREEKGPPGHLYLPKGSEDTVWPPLPLLHIRQGPVFIFCHTGVKKPSTSLGRTAHAVIIIPTLLLLELIIPFSMLSEICTFALNLTWPPQVHAVDTCSLNWCCWLRELETIQEVEPNQRWSPGAAL